MKESCKWGEFTKLEFPGFRKATSPINWHKPSSSLQPLCNPAILKIFISTQPFSYAWGY